MTRVKVIGAGSIGNHLSNASRRLGWDVDICDLDPKALERTRNEIYPGRYGEWDAGIGLYHTDEVPRGGYDYIFIGTSVLSKSGPPDSVSPRAQVPASAFTTSWSSIFST